MTIWTDATEKYLVPGTTVKSRKGRLYAVLAADEKAVTLERPDTGSRVRVTRGKVEKTAARLAEGEEIPFRKIDYTVAVEEGVIAALGDLVEVDNENRTYRSKS